MKNEFKTLVIFFIGFWIIGVLIHESGHQIAGNLLLGGPSMIHYECAWDAGHIMWLMWLTLPKEHAWLVILAGGLTAALFLFVFFWIPGRMTGKTAIEVTASFPILANFFYAPNELLSHYYEQIVLGHETLELLPWAKLHAVVVAAIIFLLIYGKKTIEWLKV